MRGKGIFWFLLGAACGATASFVYCKKKMEEAVSEESDKIKKYYLEEMADSAKETYYPERDEAPAEGEKTVTVNEESPDVKIVSSSGEAKPNIFDYAKLSDEKHKKEEPVVQHSNIDAEDEPLTCRKISEREFDNLSYSYDLVDLKCYQDGYITNDQDIVRCTIDTLYKNGSINDRDEDGYIYLADDSAKLVYTVSVLPFNYSDLYDTED